MIIYRKIKAADEIRCKYKPLLQALRVLMLLLMQRIKPTLEQGLPQNATNKDPLGELIALSIVEMDFSQHLVTIPSLLLNIKVPERMHKIFSVCSMSKSICTCIGNMLKTGLLQLGHGQQNSEPL